MMMRILPLLIICMLCGIFACGLWRSQHDPALGMTIASPYDAPPLDLPALADNGVGAPVHLHAFSGRWLLVNYFASWCLPCEMEMADFKALAAGRDGQKLAIVGIAYKDKPDAARTWLARLGSPYDAVFLDADGRRGIDWGITGVPESFLVDPAGRIVWRVPGAMNAAMIEREVKRRVRRNAE